MDDSVALVQAYLRINGYFTVTEYPVLEIMGNAARSACEIDVLALRFPDAAPALTGTGAGAARLWRAIDPALGAPHDAVDMIVGEVKEGRARMNPAMRDPDVLTAVLTRFGCCGGAHVEDVVRALLRRGHGTTPSGHRVRLVCFGSTVEPPSSVHTDLAIPLAHILGFLRRYLREHWHVLRHAQFRDPAFGFLMTLEKAERGGET